MKVKIHTDPNAWMDEPIKAEKWRNLYFLKSGGTRWGMNTASSKNEALAIARDFLSECARFVNEHGNIECEDPTTGEIWRPYNYSYAIQMPVKP